MQLRPYQQTLADQVRAAYRDGYKCPLVVASTGAGKTILFSYITHNASLKGNPVLVAAHRKEIIRQIALSLAKFGVMHQVIAAPAAVRAIKVAQFKAFGRSFVSADATTMVGSVQTIVGRLDAIDAVMKRCAGRKLMIIQDEAHHCTQGTQWGRVMDHCAKYQALGLLVTASPERLDGTGLGAGHGGYADTMIQAPGMDWLIENGYLSPYRIFTTPNKIDMTGVHSRMGDYVSSEVEEVVDRPSITGDAIAHWRKHAQGMRTVAFCASVNHSRHVAEQFRDAGIPAAHIDGGLDDTERDQAIMDFADGRVLVLCNVGLVSEGFDLSSIAQKDVTIDCLVDLSPTKSLVNAMQRWGRALRPAPGKTAVILDHASNVLQHGLPDTEREWSLEGRKKSERRKKDDEPDILVRTCPVCFAITKPIPICPNCGHVHEINDRKIEEREGDLSEITDEQKEALRRQVKQQQGRAQTVDEMMAALGYSRGRAEKIVQAREEKDELRQQARQAMADWFEKHRKPVKEFFGVWQGDINKLKPKELKNIIAMAQGLI